ncbi:hypothetical protein DMA12_47670 [Amycolatopsis balhimycina DSM 5908]|uniref:Uncharacterized protein n=1 Tax=Amycolatopsis balhimycina DSM 5908 TaxID=1081091 RepID=A0A428VUV1_AMYBA|nr:hypothetical protein [Amycolatopsis balhimycina]RSM34603.1 hypothetical protein DMA12_47670 [Amycolatopsis balhimycina DSM 5908]
MDPADAFVNLYDSLCWVDADLLTAWSETEEVQEIAGRVRLEVEVTNVLGSWWMPPNLSDKSQLFGVLLGLDLALLHASKQLGYLGSGVLDDLMVRLTQTGRLNDQTSGLLLFRRTSWLRPNEDREYLDGFLNLLRVPPPLSTDVHIEFVPEAYDLPDREALHKPGDLDPPPPVTVAQLPFLAERDDVEWTLTETGRQGFYTVGPASERLRPRVRDALDALDSSGAAIGFLPEASLDDELLMVWRELLKNTPRPDKSSLTWLLLGSGPVLSVGSQPHTDRLTNRAVVLHRNGRDRPLLIQDKASGFCFTTQKQEDFKLDLGCKRDERIPHSRAVALLESRSGRFGVQICEDLNRLEHQQYVVAAGVTHLLVPVLAGAMWPGGWQANAGQQLALATGSKIAVGNSLVLERFFEDKSAPTLLTIGGPASPPSEYLSTDDLVRGYPNPVATVSEASEAIDDALTARVADW